MYSLKFLALLAAVLIAPARSNSKHVLFIVADDLGWDDCGFRNPQIQTPVIDNMAAKGVVLGQYYVQPSCSPTRSTFLSGRYPLHHGVNNFIPPTSSYGLPLNETTLADLMTKSGYSSHAIGKWHCGMMAYTYTPTFRGFQSFYGYYGGGEDYFKHDSRNAYDLRRDSGSQCGKGCSHLAVEDYGNYSTHLFTREAVKIVQQHDTSAGAAPLFLYLAYQAVHAPDEAPASYIAPYAHIKDTKRRIFAGMLSCMDEGIGNVTKALAAKQMLKDTFIVFTTVCV
jgi:arylsulfatase A-like enzyme